ncbi:MULTISPECIES: YveK family protein [Staphylococcus]|uniref:YveK family protein n=1 Tax=Staphylococcus TaxID=1279 RepID=UPI001AEC602B|nr:MULTISPECIES: Wzz/FepE/Etk N-terminal domain-containing protein [unclassified Staphylococcus]
MKKNITFREIIKLIKENVLFIGLIVLIFGLISFVISQFVITPQYEATSKVIINQNKDQQENLYDNPNEVQTNIQLIKTYSEIIDSNEIKSKAIKQANVNENNEVEKGISITSEENSQIIKINVINKDPKIAVNLANTIAELSKVKIKKVMGIDNLSILSKATNNQVTSPSLPNKPLNIVIGLFIGLVLSLLIIFIRYLMNNKIKTEKEVEDLLSLPTIGKINDLGGKKNEKSSR